MQWPDTVLNMFIIRNLMIKTTKNAFGPSNSWTKAKFNWLVYG